MHIWRVNVLRWILLVPGVVLGALLGTAYFKNVMFFWSVGTLPGVVIQWLGVASESVGFVVGATLGGLIAPSHQQTVIKIIYVIGVGFGGVGIFSAWVTHTWPALVSGLIVLGLCGFGLVAGHQNTQD